MSSEHQNSVLAKDLWQAVADGDGERIRLMLDEDVYWTSVGDNPIAGDAQGPDDVLDQLAIIGEITDDLRSSLRSVFVNDEGAVALYHVSATRGTKTLEMDYLLLLRIVDGRVVTALSVPFDPSVNDEFWR